MTAQQKISLNQVIWIDPERMSGAPCFRDTRVPVQDFVDYIENGSSINEFLEDFPSVSREHLVQFMELAKEQLIECVSS